MSVKEERPQADVEVQQAFEFQPSAERRCEGIEAFWMMLD
jgi:hypothetical protein